MRRVLATLGTAALLLAGGCGMKSYETRLNRTLENMQYQDRLNKLLTEPLTKGKWEELSVYLRPPKNLAPMKEWALAPAEPGKFDIESSFLEPQKQSMHVLVRVKRAKPTGKKKAPTPADTADRTNFNRDVLNILNESYKPAEEITLTKFKPETKRSNEYRYYTTTVNGRNVQVYLLQKSAPYDVALIFEYPKSEQSSLFSKIGMCLESLAVGEKARRYFSGATSEEEASGGGGSGAPVAF